MARPKIPITFFARDIDLTNDTRIRKVLRKHGSLGVLTYEEILGMLYKTGTYYLRWNEDYILDIADRLYEQDEKKVQQAFETILDAGLFSREIFERDGVLTSHGVKERVIKRLESIKHRKLTDSELETEIGDYRENKTNKDQFPGISGNNREFAGECGNLREYAENCPPKVKDKVKDKDIQRESTSLSFTHARNGKIKDSAIGEDNNLGYAAKTASLAPGARSDENNKNILGTPEDGLGANPGAPSGSDKIAEIIKTWNNIFSGTDGEFRKLNLDKNLKDKITSRLKLDPNIETYKKVFQQAKREFDGKSNRGLYRWTLPAVFNKPDNFEQLKVWATAPSAPSQKQIENKTIVKGYSDPSSYASAEEWQVYGKK